MKYTIIVLLFMSLPIVVTAQQLPVNTSTNKVTYSEVLTIPNQSQASLFNKTKKWIATKNSEANPYIISYESESDGSITGKGSFSLPVENRKYTVLFVLNVGTKDGKCKYSFTDFVIQFRTTAGSSGGGFSYWSGSSYHEAETLEYTLETFYPIRLEKRRKPSIKWYEEIQKASFETIDREMESIVNSFKQVIRTKDNW